MCVFFSLFYNKHVIITTSNVLNSAFPIYVNKQHNNENTEPNTSTTPKTSYSRASKSLGLLTLSFLSLSSGDNSRIISVDKSAVRLGVERRRVYDVVNILSSLR